MGRRLFVRLKWPQRLSRPATSLEKIGEDKVAAVRRTPVVDWLAIQELIRVFPLASVTSVPQCNQNRPHRAVGPIPILPRRATILLPKGCQLDLNQLSPALAELYREQLPWLRLNLT